MARYKWVTTDATHQELAGKAEGRSDQFNSYVDSSWINDCHIPTLDMAACIVSLHPTFDIDVYLEDHLHESLALQRIAGKI